MSSNHEPPDLIAWIDLETTGLETYAQIIEVGMIVTDGELNTLGVIDTAVWRTPHPKTLMSEYVIEMHTENGLLEALGNPELPSIAEVQTHCLDLLDSLAAATDKPPEDIVIALAGSGVSHFDRRVLKTEMPLLERRFVYWCYDIGVLRRTFELAGINVDWARVDNKAHRAIDDVADHLEEMRLLTAYLHHNLAEGRS